MHCVRKNVSKYLFSFILSIFLSSYHKSKILFAHIKIQLHIQPLLLFHFFSFSLSSAHNLPSLPFFFFFGSILLFTHPFHLSLIHSLPFSLLIFSPFSSFSYTHFSFLLPTKDNTCSIVIYSCHKISLMVALRPIN
jgi:hypothetical protein